MAAAAAAFASRDDSSIETSLRIFPTAIVFPSSRREKRPIDGFSLKVSTEIGDGHTNRQTIESPCRMNRGLPFALSGLPVFLSIWTIKSYVCKLVVSTCVDKSVGRRLSHLNCNFFYRSVAVNHALETSCNDGLVLQNVDLRVKGVAWNPNKIVSYGIASGIIKLFYVQTEQGNPSWHNTYPGNKPSSSTPFSLSCKVRLVSNR